jgi:4-amino-4-deoxy-L-arabinose transferase-like glycosyltransferase
MQENGTLGTMRMGRARAPRAKALCLRREQMAIALGLGLVVLLGAFLRFYQLGTYSIGNSYYAATIKSMLTSWHNFFFAAYEPGGSVTVDKPPLGFWVQAASAYVLGLNGFALALPQALAGTLSIPLLYGLVKRQFGVWSGLIAALALAVLPVAVSTERNNTIDGLLLFVLLLATWAFWRATRSGRLRDLLLGAVLVGLGFNIKMLQAFLPLPALYLLYILGAPQRWWKRALRLALATIILLAVSLSWAIAVDLTPAESRPYIGSSTNNTVMELILGHNGLKRLNLGQLLSTGDDAGSPLSPSGGSTRPQPPGARSTLPGPGNAPPPGGPPSGAQQLAPPPAGPVGMPRTAPPPQGNGRASEVGQPGWLRLFSAPLVTEASWLLPVALLGIPLTLLVLGRPWPQTKKHLALVLWAGWLLPEVVYFSLNTGLFHAYYLIMLGPPLAALVGATAWSLWHLIRRRRWIGWILTALILGLTLLSQLSMLREHLSYAVVVAVAAVPLLLGGLALLDWATARKRVSLARSGLGVALLSLMVAPLLWSGLTALNPNPDVALPRSGPSTGQPGRVLQTLAPGQEAILDYLLANTEPDDYLLATLSSHEASPYILATDRPVLTFGGFTGGDSVITVERLTEMVTDGEVRYVLGGQELSRRKPEIGRWVQNNCTAIEIPGTTESGPGRGPAAALYDCGA